METLIADICGTKTLLALASSHDGSIDNDSIRQFASGEYPDFSGVAEEYFTHCANRPDRACLALAGPVHHDGENPIGSLTNLPWQMDGAYLRDQLGLTDIVLANDFVAMGYCIDALGPSDCTVLQTGSRDSDALRAIIGAGTGLGQAIRLPETLGGAVIATEGGHVDFAPQNELQIRLLRHLSETYPDHVSAERLLSGQGLVNIYTFLTDAEGMPELASISSARKDHADIAPLISEHATTDATCDEAIGLFMQMYGAQAGNLALTTLSYGGLYITGGVAARNLQRMQSGEFIEAFNAKGRMTRVTAKIPVTVVHHRYPGLLGAARLAARRF